MTVRLGPSNAMRFPYAEGLTQKTGVGVEQKTGVGVE